ncbi:MAG TPA: hypothetical protein VNW23_00410 [Opitutaceae bacterium]|jgi:hypothetical protein|nr:hypothetical protein [Opitutaceae bacterium]
MPKFSKKTSVSPAGVDKFHRRLSVMEGIALGEQALREGRVYSQAEAKQCLASFSSSVDRQR